MKINIIILIVFFIVHSLQADRGIKRNYMLKEQRVALIIGNNNYENLSILKNPINDARAMNKILQDRGFKTIYKENANKKEMKKLVKKFSNELSKGGVGMYFFAGHGVNVEGKNYLIGTDSLMEDKDEVEFETLSLNYITAKMKSAGNRLNIIVLDACRNNPFGRSGGGGLAPISNASGIFVAYATEAGSVASDGKTGKNGLFTRHLIENIKLPGDDLARVFKNTRRGVYEESDGKQSPGVYDQTIGDFFFTLNGQKKIPTATKTSFPIKTKNPDVLNTDFYEVNIKSQKDTLSIKSKAGTGAVKIGDLAYNVTGLKVEKCIKSQDTRYKEWCKISVNNEDKNIDKWVFKKYIKKSIKSELKQAKKYIDQTYHVFKHKQHEYLNVRLGTSSTYELIDKLAYDKEDITIVSCLDVKQNGKNPRWCWINYKTLENKVKQGWVSAKYLQNKKWKK